MSAATMMWLFGPCVLIGQIACFHVLCQIYHVLKTIERNTRPEPGDIRSFVKRNLEAKK